MTTTNSTGTRINLPAMEEVIYRKWQEEDTFAETLKMSSGRKQFNFYDGPPFATGSPHYGHLLAGAIKDTICRFQTLNGRYVPRKNGWDTHGLPIEQLGEKALGIKTAADIRALGIDKFNDKCRSLVLSCAQEWESVIPRFGRWIDFEGGYKTMDFEFMNATWSVFRVIHDKGLVYQGLRPMPFSTGCGSCLSHFEAKSNYQDTQDPSVVLRFPFDAIYMDDVEWLEPNQKTLPVSFLVWTTTPYSLTGNMALCISPDIEYCLAEDTSTHELYVLAAAAVPTWTSIENPLRILRSLTPDDLIGVKYCPPFHYNDVLTEKNNQYGYPVVADSYVKVDSGTGIVHLAPGMGEDDYRVCLREKIINTHRQWSIPCHINDAGELTCGQFAGMYVKEADKAIIKFLRETGKLFNARTITHSYPFCYRTDTPLIQKAVPSWFIDVHQINTRMNELNCTGINWVPESVGSARFAQWLETPHDWAFGRSRFWGTPVPIWTNSTGSETICVSSVAELESLAGLAPGSITDLHMDSIDSIRIPSQRVPGTSLTRIPDVFDCWFESGAMPYGKFAVENKLRGGEMYDILAHQGCGHPELRAEFLKGFPADFIGEGIDQTRGWFYTLLVLSTILMDNTAYLNVVVNGHILAADPVANGSWVKMSKRHKNYSSPMEAINKYGADSIRLYLLDSPVVKGDALRFNEPAVLDKGRFLVQWYNCYQFLEQEIRMLTKTDSLTGFTLTETTQVYDNWILGRLHDFMTRARDSYAKYDLNRVVPMMLEFEDLFSKWYINLSKTKMKGSRGEEVQRQTLSTLWQVLYGFSVIMSPVCPFMSETIYRGLLALCPTSQDGLQTPKSVHMVLLADVIEFIGKQFNSVLAQQVDTLVEVVMLTRTMKTQLGQSARLRSDKLVIQSDDLRLVENVRCLEQELRTAIKVSDVEYGDLDPASSNKFEIKFNIAELGKIARNKKQDVLAALTAMPAEDFIGLTELVVCDIRIPGCVWELRPSILSNEANNAGELVTNYFRTADGKTVLVSLSRATSMSDSELALEDLLKDIQKAKKSAGMKPENIADIFIRVRTTELAELFQSEQEYIDERLRSRVHLGQLPRWTIWNTHRLINSGSKPGAWSYDMYLEGALPFRSFESIIRA
jgi:isoleucyl-tRNA synthetase